LQRELHDFGDQEYERPAQISVAHRLRERRVHQSTVAGLLNKLLIKQTKSRPRHSNDNG
jgi:hypothetical protein